jgi:cytosine/uracil/thiamine/allantoin permease
VFEVRASTVYAIQNFEIVPCIVTIFVCLAFLIYIYYLCIDIVIVLLDFEFRCTGKYVFEF